MIIRDTGIPDITTETIDKAKLSLSNKLLKRMHPLFDEASISKREEINEAKKILDDRKLDVSELKFILEDLQTQYTKNKLMKQLLNKMTVLVDSGLVYDGTLKNQVVILLKMMDKLDVEKLKQNITEISVIIKKRF